jgi:ABC-2 type transport system permease protein
MKKILLVARRDFMATVTTKGFIIAVMVPPVIYASLVLLFPRLMNNRMPVVTGQVTVIDQSGEVAGDIRRYLSREALAERRNESFNRSLQSSPAAGVQGMQGGDAMRKTVIGEVPDLQILERPASALESEKDLLKRRGEGRRLAVLVIDPDAVTPAPATERFGDYDLFVRTNLDNRIQNEIRSAAADAIVNARVTAAGLDRQHIDRLTRVERGPSITVTDAGESPTSNAFNGVMPMGFALLLMISVMSSGQYLLTTTIEEKSSRTMEVILSAVSPLELLTGKILGQMAVGLTILVIYSSIGIFGLISMAMFGLLDMSLLIYLFIFFLITYVVMGSLMAAIGSAVNELREAQSLMTPITLLLMVPWLFWYPISRDPNSLFATVVSFIPPMNAFAMLLRLTSTAPPPIWQVWLSIVVGVVAAGGALWFASRIFKIGLLMHGRPPDFATLVRWARQA